jgi:hypothetical protein
MNSENQPKDLNREKVMHQWATNTKVSVDGMSHGRLWTPFPEQSKYLSSDFNVQPRLLGDPDWHTAQH